VAGSRSAARNRVPNGSDAMVRVGESRANRKNTTATAPSTMATTRYAQGRPAAAATRGRDEVAHGGADVAYERQIILIVFWALDGTRGLNRYGPDPKQEAMAGVHALKGGTTSGPRRSTAATPVPSTT